MVSNTAFKLMLSVTSLVGPLSFVVCSIPIAERFAPVVKGQCRFDTRESHRRKKMSGKAVA